MKDYTSEYYFVFIPLDESIPNLMPTDDTADRSYRYKIPPFGSAPFIFEIGNFKTLEEDGDESMDPPPRDILFNGFDVLINEKAYRKLAVMDIPNFSMHPAIYINHKNEWFEDYWFLIFTEEFDCWDRAGSKYDQEDPDDPDSLVFNYKLNHVLLDKTPLNERLLFKIGGTDAAYIIVHESIADLFRSPFSRVLPVNQYGKTYSESW